MNKPEQLGTLCHVALRVQRFAECEHFYVNLLGMRIVWRPDADNLYLSSGLDNLALHRSSDDFAADKQQHLDHLGFGMVSKDAVDAWHDYLKSNGVEIKAAPKDHRDGTRSFYCADPDGNVVQMIWLGESI